MTIKQFNEIVQKDYIDKDIYHSSKESYPLMKYDEEYGGDEKPFEKITFLSVGLNPSLTDKAREELDKILSQTSTNRVKELTDYQYKLKYSEQIQYFKQIDNFFTEISGKSTTFKDNVFHYDFCQLRKTDSKEIKSTIKEKYEILSDHLLKIIEVVNPKVVFIFNGFLSSLLLEKGCFVEDEPDKDEGCYFIKGKENKYKVVLSNQLSGGATSKVHRKFLIWHSKKLLNSQMKLN